MKHFILINPNVNEELKRRRREQLKAIQSRKRIGIENQAWREEHRAKAQ